MTYRLITGNCEDELKNLPDNSIDSVVTDPPYELGFMGKSWDSTGIAYNVDMWKEVFRVLKPGGYLLSFGGSRTYHRMACAIEDAGFEIRDQIMWVYGSGFPKSLNISKAIESTLLNGSSHSTALRKTEQDGDGDSYQLTGKNNGILGETRVYDRKVFSPSTTEAQDWEGWGTALKPAHEPIVMARKPLSEKTVAKNVLVHGTGAINIDESRIDYANENEKEKAIAMQSKPSLDIRGNAFNQQDLGNIENVRGDYSQGRWPANFIHDGSDEVVELFPDTTSGKPSGKKNVGNGYHGNFGSIDVTGFGDSGSAARFFYCAKASKKDRNEGLDGMPLKPGGSNAKGYTDDVAKGLDRNRPVANHHPTVKPTDLMRYLVRMVTPPSGTVLDPFTGSGSTGKAATLEGFNFIGVEQNPDYAAIAEARIVEAEIK
jgi:site-specific DNA-methyltransferase (adenine-specific)